MRQLGPEPAKRKGAAACGWTFEWSDRGRDFLFQSAVTH
jgi:hypothetical protein